jgi:hypothetical protein
MSNDLQEKIRQIAAAKGMQKDIINDLQKSVKRQKTIEKNQPKTLKEAEGVLGKFFAMLKGK